MGPGSGVPLGDCDYFLSLPPRFPPPPPHTHILGLEYIVNWEFHSSAEYLCCRAAGSTNTIIFPQVVLLLSERWGGNWVPAIFWVSQGENSSSPRGEKGGA